MKASLWISWRELSGRKSRLLLNAALVALAVGFCVFIELVSHSREQAVKSQTYLMDPSLKIVPPGVTREHLLQPGAEQLIDQGLVRTIEERFRKWIHTSTGRLIFKHKINDVDFMLTGYDPANIISPFEILKDMKHNEAAVGFEASKRMHAGAGDWITIGGRVFIIKGILPSSGSLDDAAIFLTLPSAQAIAGTGKSVNEINVYAATGVSVDTLKEALRKRYPDFHIVKPEPGGPAEGAMERALERHTSVLYGLVGTIVIFCIFIGAWLNAREREIELAMLYALGSSKNGILAIVTYRSLIVSLLGFAGGCVSGVISALLVDYGTAISAIFKPGFYAIAATVVTASSILATLPPALMSGYRNHVRILQDSWG